MTITIDTINALPSGAHKFRWLDDGRLECVDNSGSQPQPHIVNRDLPVLIQTSERWAWLPLYGGAGRTSTYPAWALLMAVAFHMRIETEHGVFNVTQAAND